MPRPEPQLTRPRCYGIRHRLVPADVQLNSCFRYALNGECSHRAGEAEAFTLLVGGQLREALAAILGVPVWTSSSLDWACIRFASNWVSHDLRQVICKHSTCKALWPVLVNGIIGSFLVGALQELKIE